MAGPPSPLRSEPRALRRGRHRPEPRTRPARCSDLSAPLFRQALPFHDWASLLSQAKPPLTARAHPSEIREYGRSRSSRKRSPTASDPGSEHRTSSSPITVIRGAEKTRKEIIGNNIIRLGALSGAEMRALVEAAGIEPASVDPLQSGLHA